MDYLDKLQKLKSILLQRCKEVYISEFQVKIDVLASGVICVHLSCMYDFGNYISFDLLSKISEVFNTKNINVGDVDYTPGCETCDYGSCSELDITIREFEDDPEVDGCEHDWILVKQYRYPFGDYSAEIYRCSKCGTKGQGESNDLPHRVDDWLVPGGDIS